VRGLEAADFDEQTSVTFVDRTKVRGDAVASGETAPRRLGFRSRDFGMEAGPLPVALEATRAEPGEAVVELRLGDGTAPATVTVPGTVPGGPYACTAVRAEVPSPPVGVHDVHITLRGALRPARRGFAG
jgi:beta-glucosidase